MDNRYFEEANYAIANIVPHCPVMLVLDTSHSMWGKGLTDLKRSLQLFFYTVSSQNNYSEFIDIAAVSMGGNLGLIQDFTPLQNSILPGINIRPKGDTPVGAALELALQKITEIQQSYQQQGIAQVTPQIIVLSDGKSSDDPSAAIADIRRLTEAGRLFCRTIPLGEDPDMKTLAQIGSSFPINADTMPQAFAEAANVVSQVYEEEIPAAVMSQTAPVSQYSGTEYIIDGSNVLYWAAGNIKHASLKCLLAMTDEFKRQQIPFCVVFDASAPYVLDKSGERGAYAKLLKNDPEHFYQVPAGTIADEFILQHAEGDSKRMIITNDLYRDHKEKFPWVHKSTRLIPGMFLAGMLYIPNINLQIPVS